MTFSVQPIRSELRYLVRELGLLDKNCLNSGLSLLQAHLLTYLQKNGSTSFSELCNQLRVEKASLSRTIHSLAEKNYVAITRITGDKRQKYFSLTQEGASRLHEADASANSELSQLLKLLNTEEIQNIIDGLRALRLSAFRNNAIQNKARVQIEALKSTYKKDINHLVKDIFSGEQHIPPHLVPLPDDIPQKWWIARSGEYILGAVACWKEDEIWHWGRFVVDGRFRGLGIGKSLARHSLNQMWQETDELRADARDITVGILQNLGGEVLGEKMDFYGMPVTPMRMTQQRFPGASEPEELTIPIAQ